MWRKYSATADSGSDTDSSADFHPTVSANPARSLRRHKKALWQLDQRGRPTPVTLGLMAEPDGTPRVEDDDEVVFAGNPPVEDDGSDEQDDPAHAAASAPLDIQGLFQGLSQMLTVLNQQNQQNINRVLDAQDQRMEAQTRASLRGQRSLNPENPQVFQSYNDDLVRPKPFSGKDSEDVITFLRKVQWYSQEKAERLGVDWKSHVMRYMRNYLEGDALSYFQNSDVPFKTWNDIEDRFIRRYAGVTGETFMEITTMKMERGESIDQYAARYDKACNRMRMQGEAKLHQFVANVFPEFRSSLVANPVATYEEALTRCRTISDNTDCVRADAKALKAITERLERMEMKQRAENKKGSDAKVNSVEQRSVAERKFGHKPQSSAQDQYRASNYSPRYSLRFERQNNTQARPTSQTSQRRSARQPTAQDVCFVCNRKGHFARDCWYKQQVGDNPQFPQRGNNRSPKNFTHVNYLQQPAPPQQLYPVYNQTSGSQVPGQRGGPAGSPQTSSAGGLNEQQVGHLTQLLASLQQEN